MDKRAVSKHQVSALLQARHHQYVVFAATQQKQFLLLSGGHQMKLQCPQNHLHSTWQSLLRQVDPPLELSYILGCYYAAVVGGQHIQQMAILAGTAVKRILAMRQHRFSPASS